MRCEVQVKQVFLVLFHWILYFGIVRLGSIFNSEYRLTVTLTELACVSIVSCLL